MASFLQRWNHDEARMLTAVWAFLKYKTYTKKGNIKNGQLDEFQPTEPIHVNSAQMKTQVNTTPQKLPSRHFPAINCPLPSRTTPELISESTDWTHCLWTSSTQSSSMPCFGKGAGFFHSALHLRDSFMLLCINCSPSWLLQQPVKCVNALTRYSLSTHEVKNTYALVVKKTFFSQFPNPPKWSFLRAWQGSLSPWKGRCWIPVNSGLFRFVHNGRC